MFMAQCFRFGWRRCSPLNWALVSRGENGKDWGRIDQFLVLIDSIPSFVEVGRCYSNVSKRVGRFLSRSNCSCRLLMANRRLHAST
ncbi:hypothetical protein ELS82_22535 [Vibrio ouci]|uniref:Uncharacterized protein n=1 Tax=Vibrio ouci TaxID=2499078 RepID=A0A4Y8W9C4_9VIBR|nr:hypothetical protein ELS82_22535 [Vibrio ouci]